MGQLREAMRPSLRSRRGGAEANRPSKKASVTPLKARVPRRFTGLSQQAAPGGPILQPLGPPPPFPHCQCTPLSQLTDSGYGKAKYIKARYDSLVRFIVSLSRASESALRVSGRAYENMASYQVIPVAMKD